jgi:DNA-binding IclR family transcriptional regulator
MANAGEPMSLSDLARRVGVPKSSMANLCAQLVEERLLLRVDGMFRLGPKLATLGAVYLASVDVVREFQAVCAERDRSSAETAKLATLGEHGEIVYLARHDPPRPSGLTLDVRVQQPAHCTAAGKAMLASLPDRELVRWVEQSVPLAMRTTKSLTDEEALWRAIREARQAGYAVDDEECIDGVVCVGTAMNTKDATGEVLGISIALLKQHAERRRLTALAGEVRHLAEQLVDRLRNGYTVLGPEYGVEGHPSPS